MFPLCSSKLLFKSKGHKSLLPDEWQANQHKRSHKGQLQVNQRQRYKVVDSERGALCVRSHKWHFDELGAMCCVETLVRLSWWPKATARIHAAIFIMHFKWCCCDNWMCWKANQNWYDGSDQQCETQRRRHNTDSKSWNHLFWIHAKWVVVYRTSCVFFAFQGWHWLCWIGRWTKIKKADARHDFLVNRFDKFECFHCFWILTWIRSFWIFVFLLC